MAMNFYQIALLLHRHLEYLAFRMRFGFGHLTQGIPEEGPGVQKITPKLLMDIPLPVGIPMVTGI